MRKNITISTLLKVSMLLILITASKLSFAQPCDPKWNRGKSSNCENSPIFFEANDPRTDHFWDFGQGSTSTDVNPIFNYPAAGTYYVSYKGTNSQGGNECKDTIVLVIKESPRVKTRALTPLSQCFLGNKFCFVDSTIPARAIHPDPVSKILTLRYLFSDGALYTLNDPKGGDTICHTVIDPNGGFFDLTIEAEDYNGCITKTFYSKLIRVYPKLGVKFKSNAPNACVKTVATITNLTDTFTKLKDIAKFKWDFGNPGSPGNIVEGDSITDTLYWRGPTGNGVMQHTYDVSGRPSGTYVFNGKLTVTTKFGCTETFTFGGSATIFVLNVKIIADPDSACVSTKDGLVEFTAVDKETLNPIKGASSFLWNFGDPPSGTLNTDKNTLIRAPHNYGLGPWMTTVNIRSGPCNITVYDTIFKLGPTSTIEIPFNRVSEDQKYQCVIRDTVRFPNNSSFYHVDDVSVFEDSSRVFSYFTLLSKRRVIYFEKPITEDSIPSYGTYQGKGGITTVLYLDKDTLETLNLSALDDDSIIYYVNGKKVKRKIVSPIISGRDTIVFFKQKEYAFLWPGDQTAIKSKFPPATQRHKEHALRLWSFGDNFAPKCTTDTKRNKNVHLNCNFSLDSLPVHWYTPWEDIYKYYGNSQFYGGAAEKTVLCKGGSFCYKVKYFPKLSFTIPDDTLIIIPKDSTFKIGNYIIKPTTPEKFVGTLRIKRVPNFVAGMGSYVPTLSDEEWIFHSTYGATIKNIRTGLYSTKKGKYTLKNMADQFQLEPERVWRGYTLTSNTSVTYQKLKPIHDEPIHNERWYPYKDGIINYLGTYVSDTANRLEIGYRTRFFLDNDTLETFYQKYDALDSIIYYVSGVKVKRAITSPITSGNDVLEFKKFRIVADTAFSIPQVIITPGRTVNAQPTTVCIDTIIGGRDTFVSRSRIYIDSNFHRENFYAKNAQCNTVRLYHQDTVHSLRCESTANISLALTPPNSKGLKIEGIKCYAPPSPPYGLRFNIGETKPGCTQRLLKFNFDSAGGKNIWVGHGGFLAPGLPGTPWPLTNPSYPISGAWPTRFVMPYGAGQIQNKNPGWVTVGLIIGNGRYLDVAAPLDTIECIDTMWYHNAFRMLFLDARFAVIQPDREKKTVCLHDTITFKLVDPIMDSITSLVWNWNDSLSTYYEERTFYYQPYKGPNNNRNDRVIKDWKKTDKWRYNYLIRLEYDGFKYKTLDTIVTGIIRKWSIAANVSRAEEALTEAFKQIQLVMSEIPSDEIPLYFGNGSGKGCIDTTGLGSLISYGVSPYKDALTVHNALVRKKSRIAPYADSSIKKKVSPFQDSILFYEKSKLNPRQDSVAVVDFRIGDTWYRYTDFTRKDSTIIAQKLHWRDGDQSGWDTLQERVKLRNNICSPLGPITDTTIKSKAAFFKDSAKTKSKIPVYRDSIARSKIAFYKDSTIKSKVGIYNDSTLKKKIPSKIFNIRLAIWYWIWSPVYKDSAVTVKSKVPPFNDSIIKSKVITYKDSIIKGKLANYNDTLIKSKKVIYYDSIIKSKVAIYGDSIRVNKVTNTQVNLGVYRHAYHYPSRYFPTLQLRNTEGCFQARNVEVVVGFYHRWTISDSIVCEGKTNIVLKEDIKYFAYQDPFNWLDARDYWKEPTRYLNRREFKKIDFNNHNDTTIKSQKPPYCDSLILNQFGTNGTGVPPFAWTYDAPGIYTIRIMMQDSMGCKDTAKKTVYVTGVKAGFKSLTNPTLPCKNFISFFDTSRMIDPCVIAKGKPCDNIIEYTWDFGDGKQRSKLQNPTHDFTQNGDFVVTLIVRTKLGCIDTATLTIHIEGPRPYFNPRGDTIICVNDSVSFINQSFDPTYKPSWIWDFGDGGTASDTVRDTVGHRYKKAGTYEVYLTQFDNVAGDPAHRCSAIYPDTSVEMVTKIKRLVIVKPVAPADFDITPSDTICPNSTLTFTSQSDTIYTRFAWYFSKNDSINPGGKVANFTYPTVGKYQILMIPDYDTPEFHKCLDTVKKEIVVIDVKAAFTINDSLDPKFCFKNESVGAVSYEWIFEDPRGDGTSTEVNPCFQWQDTGCHNVTLIATNSIGCTDTTVQEVCSTFVAKIIPYNVFTPNGDGVNDKFRVKAAGLDKFDIVIYNRWGEKVFESTDANFAWDGTLKNKGKVECPEGTYFYLMNYRIIAKPTNDGKDRPMSGTVTLIRDK